MINARIHTEKVEAKYAHLMPKILALMDKNIEGLLIRIQTTIKVDKLSGQVLNRITGVLSRSIHYSRELVENGLSAKIFAGVVYAKYHEYGGTWFVPAQERLSSLGTIYTVKAHMRTFKERSFLRSTANEYRGEYRDFIRAMIRRAVA